ncbi:MAG: enoyl-CoA hydratase-related protein [Acidobacteriota bacterium]|nr:enoyl-CoA hydratase-related protein [Acidobacteriota bacterium]MDQ7086948.1 enoyl-CoA hydratase-related protein [Acidobacteriota bacterium]
MGNESDASRWVHRDEPVAGVARLVLDRPPVNALSRALVARLREEVDQVGRDAAARVILIAARGRAFCAGADLKERRGMSESEVRATVAGIGALTRAVAGLPQPTLAVISGAALGGGLELALACDLRIAARSAKLGLTECSLAIIPGAGGTQRMARIAGPAVAKKWIFSARVGTADDALADRIVDWVVDDDRLEEAALEQARAMARCGPVALRAAKTAIDAGLGAGSLEAGLAVEQACYQRVLPTEDRREALSAFVEKRPPRFSGR